MTQEEYNSTEWKRGNRVMLTNGKEYFYTYAGVKIGWKI